MTDHRERRNPVTYFPVATQELYRANLAAIEGKPYAHYFNGDLWLRDDALPAIRAALPTGDALANDPDGYNRLLEPGHLPGETGFCQLDDGTGYVASLVPFPGATGEMFSWWFWWHAVEPQRYTLWYPHNHISATSLSPERLTEPGLTDVERYIGTTHHVREYIGPTRIDIHIDFVDPAELGIDTARFAEAGIVGHACARVSAVGLDVGPVATMLHLARATDDGFELRSRYWLGAGLPDELRQVVGGAASAYEQLVHDQIEFTHLAGFLPDLHAEFGNHT